MGTKREIVKKALSDDGFRKRLLKDPKATLEREVGSKFPEGVTIQVHEDSPTIIHLVLPSQLELSVQRSLTQEELEQVAGGLRTAKPPMVTLPCTDTHC